MFKKIVLGIALCGMHLSASAEALNTTSKIKTIFTGPSYGHLVFIEVESRPEQSRPSGCNANANFDFVLDLRSDYGKEHYSDILAAYAAQRTVRLISEDNCNLYSSVPGVSSIWLK